MPIVATKPVCATSEAAVAASSRTSTATICSWLPYWAAAASISDISSRQLGHQLAVKASQTGLPRRLARSTVPPPTRATVRPGASWPTFRPTAMVGVGTGVGPLDEGLGPGLRGVDEALAVAVGLALTDGLGDGEARASDAGGGSSLVEPRFRAMAPSTRAPTRRPATRPTTVGIRMPAQSTSSPRSSVAGHRAEAC